MEFNYDTSNLILFHYPEYAGGKFVMNCMGLSDSMVLQSQSLAQAQIDGIFSFDDKKEYILTHMKDEDIKKGWWGDLKMGCSELLVGDVEPFKLTNNVKTGKQHESISDTARFLSSETNNKWLFSVVCHSHTVTRVFPNAKIVTFNNNIPMINHRIPFLADEYYKLIKDHFWNVGDCPEGISDFTWDTEWLYDVTATMNGIEELYNLFNLDGWEQAKPFVKEYYHLWCEKNHI